MNTIDILQYRVANLSDLNTARNQIDAMLDARKIKFSAQLVGPTKRDNWECDAWRVSFGNFSTDYYTGTGRRKLPNGFKKDNPLGIKPKPVAPCAADVLYSLMIDAEACDQSYQDWCDNFGYDSDSIKALNTYRACEEIGRNLRKVFDHATLESFRNILQDY